MDICKDCGWPLHDDGCSACRVRKQNKLPAAARCETCKYWTGMRCCLMGKHGICTEWKEGENE